MDASDPGPMTLGHTAGARDPPPVSGPPDLPPRHPDMALPGAMPSPAQSPKPDVPTGPTLEAPSRGFDSAPSPHIHPETTVTTPQGVSEAWSARVEDSTADPAVVEDDVRARPVDPSISGKLRRALAEVHIPRTKEDTGKCFKWWWDQLVEFVDDFFGGDHPDEIFKVVYDMLPDIVVVFAEDSDDEKEEHIFDHENGRFINKREHDDDLDAEGSEDKEEHWERLKKQDAGEGEELKQRCKNCKACMKKKKHEHLVKGLCKKACLEDKKELYKRLAELDDEEIQVLEAELRPLHKKKQKKFAADREPGLVKTLSRTFSKVEEAEHKTMHHDHHSDAESGLQVLDDDHALLKGSPPPKAVPSSRGSPPKRSSMYGWASWLCGGAYGPEPQKITFRHDADGNIQCGKGARCPHCKNAYRKDSKYCRKCGMKRPPKEEEEIVTEQHVPDNPKRFPWFIVLWTAFIFLLWFFTALTADKEEGTSFTATLAGAEAISSLAGYTNLQMVEDTTCGDLRWEAIWRMWSYQFTHVGFTHVFMNCCLNLLFGTRIERLHGPLKMAFMYNFGVICGAWCFYLTVVHGSVVGCSGGCYSLLGMRVAYLFYNWREKRNSSHRHKFMELITIFTIFFVDLMLFIYSYSSEKKNGSSVSAAAHVGGALGGLFIAFIIGENVRVTDFEEKVKYASTVILVVGCIFVLVWVFATFPPATITAPNVRWCWIRNVYNRSYFGDSLWHCVRCQTQDCINNWSPPTNRWTAAVSRQMCLSSSEGFAYTEY